MFVLVVGVHGPTLADASACQLASLLRELVNSRSVLATTNLPLSKRSRLRFENNKTMSIIFLAVCLQSQQMGDINACLMNEENFSRCACMMLQSNPVVAPVIRVSSTVCHVTLF